jgi:hypothetical protein
VAALLALAAITAAGAQQSDPTPLQPGDVAWAFALEDPLFDERIAGALGTRMEPEIQAATPSGARIARVRAVGPDFEVAHVYPANDVQPLLDAAGYGNTPPFVEVGQCRVWAAPPPVDVPSAITPAEAAPILAAALEGALASLGVETTACTETDDPAEAHLLVWVAGGPAPTLMQRNEATFLSGTEAPAVPGVVPGGGQGGGMGGSIPAAGPQPASTGNAGLARDVASPGAFAAVGLLAALALLAGARLRTRRVHRRS